MALLSRASAQAKAVNSFRERVASMRRYRMQSRRLLVEAALLWTIAVILVFLWLLGVVVHIGGGLIHLLLVIAVIVALVRIFSGRSV